PMTAWISPCLTSRLTSVRAEYPAKVLVMFSSFNNTAVPLSARADQAPGADDHQNDEQAAEQGHAPVLQPAQHLGQDSEDDGSECCAQVIAHATEQHHNEDFG